ncbi:MAG: hypothetical protein DRP74_05070 [Candidatus Omnitrophota bacterium]|nr:MAG: hypothetical protein DRP74_05070 [Candidatus Omnitrophota bacterium]
MAKIRELFHKVGNWHNKISVGAGVAKAELKEKLKNASSSQEIEKSITRLSELEQHTIEASKALRQLKDAIYNIIDPDSESPRK